MKKALKPDEFIQSLSASGPENEWPVTLKALWYDRKGDWDKAHEYIQDESSGDEAWVHAYLHRKEGDLWNADYWYRRAGRKRPSVDLDNEWEQILAELLNQDWNRP